MPMPTQPATLAPRTPVRAGAIRVGPGPVARPGGARRDAARAHTLARILALALVAGTVLAIAVVGAAVAALHALSRPGG